MRAFLTSGPLHRQVTQAETKEVGKEVGKETPKQDEQASREENTEQDFQKSDKATMAAQVNLSAKLSKTQGNAGLQEVWRLIKVARPELRWLGIAFVFLVISSSVTMSIPFSVGRILDLATKGDVEDIRLFGFTLNQFFIGLGTILTLGAMANFGRVVLLRIVGERKSSEILAVAISYTHPTF